MGARRRQPDPVPPPQPEQGHRRGIVSGLRALSSALMARAGLASAAGLTFSGARDLYAALGYDRDLDAQRYWARYRRNALAHRIVDAYPQATWRGGAVLVEDEDPNNVTPFEEAWTALTDRLQVWSVLQRADILAGLGQYAVVLIGAPGILADELPQMRSQEDIAYLSPFGERDVEIKEADYVDDETDPRFGQPEYYTFNRLTGVKKSAVGRRVHWTRVIHLTDEPRLEHVWNLLDDLEKVTGGGAEAFWQRAHQGFQFDLDPEVEMDADDLKALREQIDEFVHGFRRYMRTKKVKMEAFSSEVADFDRNVGAIIEQIAAGAGIPQRILMGSERGQLASEQDRQNWADSVDDRRLAYAEPQAVRPFVSRLVKYRALPEPAQYSTRWPSTIKLDDKQIAEIAKMWAEINEKAGQTVVTVDEIRDRVLHLEPLDTLEGFDEDEGVEEDDDGDDEGTGEAEDGERQARHAEDADEVARVALRVAAKKKFFRLVSSRRPTDRLMRLGA